MENKTRENLIGRCGLYCGACIVYLASHGREELKVLVMNESKCEADDVFCDGCQGDQSKCWCMDKNWGRTCVIKDCLRDQDLSYCNECDKYSKCDKFRLIADYYINRGDNLRYNLRSIAQNKEDWLIQQDRKWKCANCGAEITRDLSKCSDCGKIVA